MTAVPNKLQSDITTIDGDHMKKGSRKNGEMSQIHPEEDGGHSARQKFDEPAVA